MLSFPFTHEKAIVLLTLKFVHNLLTWVFPFSHQTRRDPLLLMVTNPSKLVSFMDNLIIFSRLIKCLLRVSIIRLSCEAKAPYPVLIDNTKTRFRSCIKGFNKSIFCLLLRNNLNNNYLYFPQE